MHLFIKIFQTNNFSIKCFLTIGFSTKKILELTSLLVNPQSARKYRYYGSKKRDVIIIAPCQARPEPKSQNIFYC